MACLALQIPLLVPNAKPPRLALRPCHAFDDSVVFEWVESDLLLYSVR